MRKILLFICLLVSAAVTHAQYNNEWIDYSKTYYKFKVGQTGLYRISQESLGAAGIGNIPAEQFQLWRNGKQVTIYTTAVAGALSPGGYIEFWGEMNDGKTDKALYKNPLYQLDDTYSLETDTSAYFLTVSTETNNLRYATTANDVANNTLPAEPYFMYTYRADFKDQINRGKAVDYGEYVYSSTYDVGEWWSSNDVYANNNITITSPDLFVATSGPAATLAVSAAGNSDLGFSRRINASINDNRIIDQPLVNFSAQLFTASVSLSNLSSGKDTIKVTNISSNSNDRMVVGIMHLTYPRTFNFGGAKSFLFRLPASANGNYIEITNFAGGSAAPVLYDVTNNKRYIANTATQGVLKFALESSSAERTLILVSEDAGNAQQVTNLAKRNFINYGATSNQGDYLIISNKILFAGDNAAEQYRGYRASAAGGSYNAKIYDIDELVDQFYFGIKKHPLSVKNFLRYTRNVYSVKPRYVLLIGKAVTYNEYRLNESSRYADQLNLIPTFGWPASDDILASDDLNPRAQTPIGRLSVVNGDEVKIYLSKIKEYEAQQSNTTQTIDNKAWMKTAVHIAGGNTTDEDARLSGYLKKYENIIKDTLFGAKVYNFNKTTTGAATPITDALLQQLFASGIGFINYFGHSSATKLNYNLNDPYSYNNPGKYPAFLVYGCDAGNFYAYDTSRLFAVSSISEQYVLAKERGSICFVGSTHFGVESYLDTYNTGFNRSISVYNYNKDISSSIEYAINYLLSPTSYSADDSTSKYLHAEQTVLHGDPALKINSFPKPDFVIEEPQIVINPSFVSVANNRFTVKAFFYNIGKATGDSVAVDIKRQYPDGSVVTLLSKRIKSVRNEDSLALDVPIIASRDKGQNKLIVSIDNLNQYDELSEANNTAAKTFFIYEDELTPVYPYNFAIINKNNIKLAASTADPSVPSRQYTMQIDTTELFNSALKVSRTLSSAGGVIEFDPGISFTDSTVYYWRVAPVPQGTDAYHWNVSSFIYLADNTFGYNQSHLYQHLKSSTDRIYVDSASRNWRYKDILSALQITHSILNTSGLEDADFEIRLNSDIITQSACIGNSVVYTVFDPVTLKPLYNQKAPSTNGSGTYGGFMGSGGTCGHVGTQFIFEYSVADTASRRKMRDFMDWIPEGYLVAARMIFNYPYINSYAPQWKSDQAVYGIGNTWYDRLITAGFTNVDSFNYPRTWVFVYQKNKDAFVPSQQFSAGLYDRIILNRTIISPDSLGFVTSPVFGPAKAWKSLKWRGKSLDATAGDKATVDVSGITATGQKQLLYTFTTSQQDADISTVNVTTYPYIQLQLRDADSLHFTPYQLRYWRLLYDPVPEGGLSSSITYNFKDTLQQGETLSGAIAFKNISDASFTDSIKVNVVITDKSNNTTVVPVSRLKKLTPGDTAVIHFNIDSKNFSGANTLYLDVNPDNDQPEQTHVNNFMYKSFFVKGDIYNPLLDVTFDGVHILNNDIVSAKPYITIKMTDESKYLLLNDTSLVTVQLQYPDGSLHRYNFNSDTVHFTPATDGNTQNVATIDFTPYLPQDGEYQLFVTGKDRSGNTAGITQYSVSFQVINKPMISNMFNYPNPFTTSTAFVFTVTGSEIPQNIRIQILTITGKIVKEITKVELGGIHIGRNITDYKWDGTDQYGQKLANGVYLYRVLTNLNGKKLDKFNMTDATGNSVNTDQYFNKGYGKMYLMR